MPSHILQPGPSYKLPPARFERGTWKPSARNAGSNRAPVIRPDQITTHIRGERCTACNGTGIRQPDPGPVPNLADNECPACDGFGRVFSQLSNS